MIKNRIRSGFCELDKILMSFESGKLYLIAGRPAMGKTSLMLDMVLNIAKQVSVHIFSLELSKENMLKRLGSKTKSIDNLSISIYDQPITVKEITQMNINDGIIFIDYLQLLKNADIKNDNKTQDIKELKHLAEQNNIPVVVLSQLSRTADERSIKGLLPTLEDIPSIGDLIFDDVDAVIFLYRKAYYNEGIDSDEAELTVIKKYIGRTGTIVLHFDNKTGTFYE